jgi:hypothetical protein
MTRFTRKIAAAPAAVLAAAGIVLAGGGIALAASQGALQVPFTGHDNRPADAPSATATVNPGLTRTPAAHPSDDATEESSEPSASATPSPSLDGLCVAYQAGAMAKAASNPAFTALTTAAGGADNVDAYCVSRIGASTHPTHPAMPTQAATPSHGPTDHAAPRHRMATPTHPTGAPDVPDMSGTH